MAIKRSVSLYSLQEEYVSRKMTLENMIQGLESIGADLEFISDQMMRNAPFPRLETLKEWDRLIETYRVKPVCNDIFINTNLFDNRRLTTHEATDMLIHEIKLASRLGFGIVRLVSMTPPEIIEPALPYAEQYNVVLAMEVHGAMSFDDTETKAFCDIMFRLNTPYLGLVVDTGIFCKRHPRVATRYFLDKGLNPKVADYIDAIYENGSDPKQSLGTGIFMGRNQHGQTYPEALTKLFQSEVDVLYCMFACAYENTPITVSIDTCHTSSTSMARCMKWTNSAWNIPSTTMKFLIT
ncbi:MAG: sugar phosphate isomerase/epimerase [Bacillus subtilis]|nr:sugar phosphate isomerase/epimerase [Bacillus subtilis]